MLLGIMVMSIWTLQCMSNYNLQQENPLSGRLIKSDNRLSKRIHGLTSTYCNTGVERFSYDVTVSISESRKI